MQCCLGQLRIIHINLVLGFGWSVLSCLLYNNCLFVVNNSVEPVLEHWTQYGVVISDVKSIVLCKRLPF